MLGVGVATAMIAVATDIGDKISRELRTYGANLIVTPRKTRSSGDWWGEPEASERRRLLQRSGPSQIKGMFWRNNIVGFSPMLPVSVTLGDEKNLTWLEHISPATLYLENRISHRRPHHPSLVDVQGSWPDDSSKTICSATSGPRDLTGRRVRKLKLPAGRDALLAFSRPAERR